MPWSDAKSRFREVFRRLGARDREILFLLHVQDMTLREVGERIGVSESHVCQISGQLRRQVRESLADHQGLYAEALA